MFFVGIDIGKNNHVASMMDESGKVVFKAFSFPNTSDGGHALFSKLTSYSSSTDDFEIGMEATGHYWLSIVYTISCVHMIIIHIISYRNSRCYIHYNHLSNFLQENCKIN